MMRVLHSVDAFLNPTENWIYPQMFRVPGVQSRVVCGSVTRDRAFPVRSGELLVDPPPWEKGLGVPRFLNAVGRRCGLGGTFCRARISLWKPHLLHAHFGGRGCQSLDLKRRLQIPLVTSFYGFDAWRQPRIDPTCRSRYKQLFEVGDAFLVEGPAMLRRLCDLGCPLKKVHIQRIGVDLSSLPFRRNCFSNNLRIVMVGRFVEKKAFVDGLLACALARRQGANLTATIIGDARTDDTEGQRIKSELQALAQGSDLAGCVQFAGFLPLQKMRDLLGSHNVFLCPSKRATNGDAEGGSPVALTEAIAMGLFPIGTRHCDIPDVILDGKTGFLCDEGDVEGIAHILTGIERAPVDFQEMTCSGRKHIETHFSLETQMQKLRTFYDSLELSAALPLEGRPSPELGLN